MLLRLSAINAWIFDLDNTLYPASARLFELVDARMGAFIQTLLGCDAIEARRVQKGFFRERGTTLAGLMATHGVDPHEFLNFVHDIPLDRLVPDPVLAERIRALPGRKLVYTNADKAYAGRVLSALGLEDVFTIVHDIADSGFTPKPNGAAMGRFCVRHRIDAKRAVFVEDLMRNLVPAKALGMTCVWINNGSELGDHGGDKGHIDFEAASVSDWLDTFTETD
jgi:putative hydrolase of the HAD superfamily